MKISDDAHDRRNNRLLGLTAAVICGVSIGCLAVSNADAAVIFLGILIGTVLAWKVDCLNHIISLIIFLAIIIILGFPSIGLITLIICAAAAYLDEIGNDSPWASKNNFTYNFFQYRFTLKIVILSLAIIGLLNIPYLQIPSLQTLSIYTFISFLLFELSYEIVGLKFNAIYDTISTVFKQLQRCFLIFQRDFR